LNEPAIGFPSCIKRFCGKNEKKNGSESWGDKASKSLHQRKNPDETAYV